MQHPTGGIVGELRVHDGEHVKAGDILVRLDETVMRANLAIITKGLNELTARKARLEAERDGADEIAFPPALLARTDDPDAVSAVRSERKLFELRRTERTGQKAQLQQRMSQLNEEIAGIEAQQAAKSHVLTLIERELNGVRDLYAKNLVQLTRLTQLEREAARLGGERAQLVASAAQAKGKIAEISLQIIQIDQNLSSEVAKEMRDIDGKIGEFVERKVTAEDQLRRTDIRAPQTGAVFQSTVHTIGGVITFVRVQQAHHAGDRRQGDARFGRYLDRPAHRSIILYDPHCPAAGERCAAWRCAIVAGHAGGSLRANR